MKQSTANKPPKPPKPKYNLWQTSAYMIRCAWAEHKTVLLLCVVTTALSVASSLVQLFVVPTILNTIEAAAPLRALLTVILLFSAALMLLSAMSSYVSTNTIFGRIKIRSFLVNAIHEKYMQTSYPNTEDQDVLKMLEKARSAVGGNAQATEAVWDTLTALLTHVAGFLIYLALLSTLEPWLIVITVAATGLGFFINTRVTGWEYRHRDEEAEHSRRMWYISRLSFDFSLAKDIRVFGMYGWLTELYDSLMRLYRAYLARVERVHLWAGVAEVVLSFLRNGAAYIFLIRLTLNNGLTASQFLLYFSAVGGFAAWVSGIMAQLTTLHKQSTDISVVREFIEREEIFAFEGGVPLMPQSDAPYKLELRDVTFRYPGAKSDTLQHMNLTVNPGEKLAVVGLNGAGKTTLIKLLCGFHDPTEGEVLLNGKNIKAYNRRDYYRHFAAVFQAFSVLAGTLAENVAQTDTDIDHARVRDCLAKAGLRERVDRFPAGTETHISKEVYEDGVDLSGGEMQRLMLARALYKNAPMLVLDEPTAALDPIAERDMYTQYNEMTRGRTAVYISHRLASTRFCDRIIFIENGVIAEEGTHDTLIKKQGKYAALFEIQSRYYREGGEKVEAI